MCIDLDTNTYTHKRASPCETAECISNKISFFAQAWFPPSQSAAPTALPEGEPSSWFGLLLFIDNFRILKSPAHRKIPQSHVLPFLALPMGELSPKVTERVMLIIFSANAYHPSATSSTIINANPTANAAVPMCECSPSLISGISSSTTTYSIAPAAKLRR